MSDFGNLVMVEALNQVEKKMVKRPAEELLVAVICPKCAGRNFSYLKNNDVCALTVVADYSTVRNTGEYHPTIVYGAKARVVKFPNGAFDISIAPTRQWKFNCCGKWQYTAEEAFCKYCNKPVKDLVPAKFKLNKELYRRVKNILDKRNYPEAAFLPELYLAMPADKVPVSVSTELSGIAAKVKASFNRRGQALIPYEVMQGVPAPDAVPILVSRWITVGWFRTEALKAAVPYKRQLIPKHIGK